MRAMPLLLTGTLAAGGIATAALVAPGGVEQIAMYSRDGHYERAADLGNRIHVEGEGSPNVLATLFDLNGYTGDPARAREAIDEYLEQRPEDVAMLRRAVDFFAHHQDFQAYLRLLERLVELSPGPGDVARLAALYRVHGRFEDERRVLYAHRDAGLLPEAVERLAQLLAREGDYAQAAELLVPVAEKLGSAGRAVRSLLFETLVKGEQAERASEMASRWAARGLDPASQAIMVLTLAEAGQQAAAERLAATFPRTSGYDPAPLAWALNEQRRFDLVRIVLRNWLDGADRAGSARAAGIYVDVVAQAGALGEMTSDLHAMLAQPGAPQARTAMAVLAVAYARWGYPAVSPLRHLLPGEMLIHEPLFAAGLATREGNMLAARYFLVEADLSDADDDAADDWYSLAETAFGPREIALDLSARLAEGHLSPAVYPYLQKAAIAAGLPDPIFEMLRAGAPTGAGL